MQRKEQLPGGRTRNEHAELKEIAQAAKKHSIATAFQALTLSSVFRRRTPQGPRVLRVLLVNAFMRE